MLALGDVIWVSVRPLLRLVICTSFGFAVTKAGIFPLEAARGAGQVMLNILLPSLMFSKIVPAFTPQNAGALGPLILVSVFYQAAGILIAWIVKQFFWVPHRFRYGILAAGGWGNYGDIPTSVLMSITGSAPFNGASDQNLSVAYLAAFLLIFCVTLFPMGGHRLIAMDYVGPDVDDDKLRMSVLSRLKESIVGWRRFGSRLLSRNRQEDDAEAGTTDHETKISPVYKRRERLASMAFSEPPRFSMQGADLDIEEVPVQITRQNTRTTDYSKSSTTERITVHVTLDDEEKPTLHLNDHSLPRQPQPVNDKFEGGSVSVAYVVDPTSDVAEDPPVAARSVSNISKTHRTLIFVLATLKSFMIPPTLSILTAFPIALVRPLKALFTPVPNSPIPNAPDGQPPLAFILDAATFVGAASVPVSLICLGSALARLHIPRNKWTSLPYGAITWLAIGKMLIMPVVGVAFTQGLVSAGVIDADDKVLRLVCIFMSCVPTATTQVFLTQVYSGTGQANHVSAFLVPQYAIMLVSMTAVIAYSLSLLF